MLDTFFTMNIPPEAEQGTYQFPLVILSYVVASAASYTALVISQMMVGATSARERSLFHWGGAFAMGAGIWSMHFVGMLSYKMTMEIHYDPWVTFLSLVVAIVASWGALGIITRDRLPVRRLLLSGILMGVGICSMHYVGMAAMGMDATLRYTPGFFVLSFVVAVIASIAALWMSFTLARAAGGARHLYQAGAALVMGAAICGMHYTGMASAVFIPFAQCRRDPGQNFEALAWSVAATTGLVLGVALAVAAYRKAQAEQKALGSEARLRAVIDSALDAVVSVDQQDRITEWNRQAEIMFGWTRAEALGLRLAETVILPQYRPSHYAGLAQFLKTGECPYIDRRVEIDAMRRDGRVFPIEVSVTAQHMGGEYQFNVFARDVADRRAAESTRALLAAIVEFTDDAIISETLGSTITSWNKAAERLFGYAPEEAVGRNVGFLIPGELRGEEENIIARIREGHSIDHHETERVRKDGSRVPISLTISPIRDKAGRIIGASKIARDITDRKAAEAELLHYTNALERSNQELDDFAHIASHDLKEPLRGLVIQANFLSEDYADKLDEHGQKRLLRLRQLSQRMEKLITDLLYFSQLGRTEMAVQETDLNPVVDEIRLMLEQFLKERNGRIIVPKPLPKVVCDKLRVTEALRNLLTNAIKYNDKAERTAEVGFLDRVGTKEGVERDVFYVRDNGVGIPPEFRDEVFRIFRRLHNASEKETGTGAGLTFVKKIVERHNGRVWIESEPGQGTTFYFTLKQPARHA